MGGKQGAYLQLILELGHVCVRFRPIWVTAVVGDHAGDWVLSEALRACDELCTSVVLNAIDILLQIVFLLLQFSELALCSRHVRGLLW